MFAIGISLGKAPLLRTAVAYRKIITASTILPRAVIGKKDCAIGPVLVIESTLIAPPRIVGYAMKLRRKVAMETRAMKTALFVTTFLVEGK